MPRGFIGRPASEYLGKASDAHQHALQSGNRVTENAPGTITMRARSMPFSPEDALAGDSVRGSAGMRNIRSIAVDQAEYDAIGRALSIADEKMGACLYQAAMEIETLCQTAFILPSATPRCVNISGSVKGSLNQFRDVTEDAVIQIKRFASDMINLR